MIKEILAEAARLRTFFENSGAQAVETSILQPARLFVELYGEDIRARTYTTADALRGEQMLRPDFTVPILQMHIDTGSGCARYTYSGEVFRRQEQFENRPNEYLQVGYELIDKSDPVEADVEVFSLFSKVLSPFDLRSVTGDIGILTAAINGLQTTKQRKSTLMRHIWRPKRFRELLNFYAGRTSVSAYRTALLAENHDKNVFPEFGMRCRKDVLDRIAQLKEDAMVPAISMTELTALDQLLEIRGKIPKVIEHLEEISTDIPAIRSILNRLKLRTDSFVNNGIDVNSIDFEVCYGRTQMEYYDGFVFGFFANDRPNLPPVSTGGRYDALTVQLDTRKKRLAVGGAIRPDLILELIS
ncbi:MAG: ATP phosphoribosyltransferase regulatory subunit [Aestuariivita sp.]|nr:ATP phosphoribosyltransferase regulatory subunit [Aestuariivita sp.]